MSKYETKSYLLTFTCMLSSSCAIYTISTSSLKEQFIGIEPEKRSYYILAGALFMFNELQVNNFNDITVIDENGREE